MKETLNSRVAVLETRVEAINVKLDEVRSDIKELHACLHKTRELILNEVKALREADNQAHREQNQRIMSLENWRWYTLGFAAAVAIIAKFVLG
jgi:outer membrane murein-binding lipoprotein Lpp